MDRNPASPQPNVRRAWWGEERVELGDLRRWRVGPASVWAERQEREWRVWRHQDEDFLAAGFEVAAPASIDEIPAGATMHRYGFERTPPLVSLVPALADRPMIVKPESPFSVPSGESATLFVGTPTWIAVRFGSPPQPLLEFPSFRPSDTWFGPSTREGELCYATRTAARLDLTDMPVRANRAITPVRIRNRASDALLVERLKVPVMYLSLFHGPHAKSDVLLWTEPLTLARETSGDLAELQIERAAPVESGRDAIKVADRRQQPEANLALRAFAKLFGGS